MDTLLSCCLHDPAREELVYIPRFTHRLSLIDAWGIAPGQRLLDIGCGQGESALVLAVAVGPSGHVTGIDDAPPDYGTPFATGESHQYIGQSALGPRITFHLTDTPSFLPRSPSAAFDAAVLCLSLWYFPTRQSVLSLFHTLATATIPKLYLAEYSLQASDPSQRPHVLSTRVSALMSAAVAESGVPGADLRAYNARTPLEQAAILDAARDAGYVVRRHGRITPQVNMLEGHFEASYMAGNGFRKRVEDANLPSEQEAEILALTARIKEELDELDKKGIRTVRAMDSWWAVLELDPM